MKLFIQIILILIVFFKTGNLLSENDLFNVNNIQLVKKEKSTNISLANQAIKKGFNELIEKILLKEDVDKLSDLDYSSIKELVSYYQISEKTNEEKIENFVKFNITFDKVKIHDLFYKRGISYSEIVDKELYVLPILIKDNEIFVFSNNFFYDNWNNVYKDDLIEFILPLENIEIIQNINRNKKNLIDLKLNTLLQEYSNKNLALIFIEDNQNSNSEKIYLKTIIHGKNISKSLNIKKQNLDSDKFYEKVVIVSKKELINLIKSENLIDIRTPSFLNTKLKLNNSSNLVDLNSRLKKIDLIENMFVQEFNKDYVKITIKYLGKLEKIVNQLKKENINLKLVNDEWVIETL